MFLEDFFMFLQWFSCCFYNKRGVSDIINPEKSLPNNSNLSEFWKIEGWRRFIHWKFQSNHFEKIAAFRLFPTFSMLKSGHSENPCLKCWENNFYFVCNFKMAFKRLRDNTNKNFAVALFGWARPKYPKNFYVKVPSLRQLVLKWLMFNPPNCRIADLHWVR